jgi:hypothetical protein
MINKAVEFARLVAMGVDPEQAEIIVDDPRYKPTPPKDIAYNAMLDALESISEVEDNGWYDGTATVNINYRKVERALALHRGATVVDYDDEDDE